MVKFFKSVVGLPSFVVYFQKLVSHTTILYCQVIPFLGLPFLNVDLNLFRIYLPYNLKYCSQKLLYTFLKIIIIEMEVPSKGKIMDLRYKSCYIDCYYGFSVSEDFITVYEIKLSIILLLLTVDPWFSQRSIRFLYFKICLLSYSVESFWHFVLIFFNLQFWLFVVVRLTFPTTPLVLTLSNYSFYRI